MNTFHETISSNEISDLSNSYQDLARKIPYHIWNHHMDDELGKNNENFDLNSGKLLIVLLHFGKHSCKMFVRGKPIKFGHKI